jgi:iron complex outermembrane recepter protein
MGHFESVTGALLAIIAACSSSPVVAQSASREYDVNIERLPVAAALSGFSIQTGLQILHLPSGPVEDLLIGPVKGQYTAEQAITHLLLGTNLRFHRINERTIAITGPFARRPQRGITPTSINQAAAPKMP